jgi:AAA+ ATPase superfamily predicted ATPase
MTFSKKNFIHRKTTEIDFQNLFDDSRRTASMCFLRGRRRVGKSTFIKQINYLYDIPCFIFTGADDESELKTKKRWVKEWMIFYPETQLSQIKTQLLTWKMIFSDLAHFAQKNKQTFCVSIDEIQWIAKGKSGFVSQLKESWLELEKYKNLKLILCGSSNKFFQKYSGGEEQILRGLCTHNDIWMGELNLADLKKHYTPQWSDEEIVFSVMCLGGIPFYWQQLPSELNFIQAFNKLCFTSSSFVLKEIGEILRLEFNRAGVKTVIRFLSFVGFSGKTLENLETQSRTSHATATQLIDKLQDYGLLFRISNFAKTPISTARGQVYILKDPFLNFYFNIIYKLKRKIEINRSNDLIFASLITSKKGIYIPEFTGPAFERFIGHLLETSADRGEKLFAKLNIRNCDFDIGTIKDPSRQIDIVLQNTTDRRDRWIECRWTNDTEQISTLIEELQLKLKSTDKADLFIMTNCKLTSQLNSKAEKYRVKLLGLQDLF